MDHNFCVSCAGDIFRGFDHCRWVRHTPECTSAHARYVRANGDLTLEAYRQAMFHSSTTVVFDDV